MRLKAHSKFPSHQIETGSVSKNYYERSIKKALCDKIFEHLEVTNPLNGTENGHPYDRQTTFESELIFFSPTQFQEVLDTLRRAITTVDNRSLIREVENLLQK